MVASKAFANHRIYSSIAFYACYLILALTYGLLWSRYPTLGLSSFLTIAALHFGSDWHRRGIALTRLAYGLTIVTLPALAHPADVAAIYAALGTTHAPLLIAISKVLAVIAVVVGGAAAAAQCKQRSSDLYEFLAIVLGATCLGPLVFFTCYFCLLHSPRHLLETAEELGIASLRRLCIVTIPILLATVALAGGVWLLLPNVSTSTRIMTLVFVGLAALTVPHMLLDRLTDKLTERLTERSSS
jgi:Brp/Blh family beta-carotene 15,15'-monooxygenase